MNSENFEVEIQHYQKGEHRPLMFRMSITDGTVGDDVVEYEYSMAIEVGGRDLEIVIDDSVFQIDLKFLIFKCVDMHRNDTPDLRDT